MERDEAMDCLLHLIRPKDSVHILNPEGIANLEFAADYVKKSVDGDDISIAYGQDEDIIDTFPDNGFIAVEGEGITINDISTFCKALVRADNIICYPLRSNRIRIDLTFSDLKVRIG